MNCIICTVRSDHVITLVDVELFLTLCCTLQVDGNAAKVDIFAQICASRPLRAGGLEVCGSLRTLKAPHSSSKPYCTDIGSSALTHEPRRIGCVVCAACDC